MPLISKTSYNHEELKISEFDDISDKCFLNKKRYVKKIKTIKTAAKSYLIANFSVRKIFPFLTWIKVYEKSFISKDIIAGIITAIVMVVQALAIAQALSVPPEYGIYSTFIGGIVGFFFGTSKDSSFGPSLILAIGCARYNKYQSPISTSIIAFFSGIFLTLASLFKFGFIMEFISYPVLSGFITSGAITIFISQLPGMFGISIENMRDMSAYEILHITIISIPNSKIGDSIIGLSSLIISYGISFLLPFVNEKLKSKLTRKESLAYNTASIVFLSRIGWIILFGSVACYLGTLNSKYKDYFSVVGHVPGGFPMPWNPFQPIITNNATTIPISEILSETSTAFILAPILTFVEALSSSRNFGKIFSYQVDNNLELITLGFTNIIGSFFRNFPVGSALARTSVNALSGSKSRFSGLLTSVLMIIVMISLMPVISFVSKASLAGCICAAGLSQIQILALINLWKISKLQILPWLATVLIGLYRLEIGMLVGFIVSAGFIMFRELRPRIDIVYNYSNHQATFCVKGAIHFPGSFFLVSKLRTINKKYPQVTEVIIDCSTMYETDTSVVEELKEAVDFLKSQSLLVTICHLKKGRVQTLFLNAGLKDSVYRGLRTGSCHADFKYVRSHHHFIAYHDNPRDICESSGSSTCDDLSIHQDSHEDDGTHNYLEND